MTRAPLLRAAALVVASLLVAAGAIGFLLGGISLTGAAPEATPTESPTPSASPTPLPTPEPTPTASPTPEPTPTPVPTPSLVAAPLTGRPVTEALAQQHVVAVMIDDHPAARPQSGLAAASVVWQAPAEGGVPRYMALFQEQMPVSVGPIRSARSYFIAWAAEWRAVYAHVGGSPQAIATLATYGRGQYVYNADQFRWGTRYFWRSTERFAPHNVYTDGKHLRGLSKAVGAKDGPIKAIWRFAPDAPFVKRPRDGRIVVKYSYNTIRYDYDRLTNTYLRTVSSEGAEEDSAQASRERGHGRLDEHLRGDVDGAGADGAAQADLADPLAQGEQHQARRHDVRLGRAGPAEADVVGDRAAEQEGVLQHHAELPTQRTLRDAPHVDPVEADAPAGHVVESTQQLDQRRFARARLSDERDHLAGLHFEADVAQHRQAIFVGEVHLLECDAAGDARHLDGIRRVDDLRLGVEHLEDALAGGHRRLKGVVALRQIADRIEEQVDVQHEGDQHAGRDGVAQHLRAADPHHERDGERADEIDGGEKER